MARLKFLVFALVVLGAWAAHLYLLSPSVSARAVEQAEARAAAAPAVVAVRVQERRIELQRAALNVAADTEALALLHPAKTGKVEAPSAEKLSAFRAALGEAVPAPLRDSLVLGLVNDEGAIAVRGDKPVAAEELEVADLARAGGDGLAREAFGQSHLFYSVPVTGSEGRVVAHVVVGAPLVTPDLIEAVAKDSGLGGVGLLKDGKVVQAAGAQKAMVQTASAKIASGKSQVLQRGAVATLGPLQLPVLTGGGLMGGDAPLAVSSRQPLSSTPFEVVTIASVAPFMTSLAGYQRLAVFGFGGIFLLSLVFLLVMGGGKPAASAREEGVAPAEAARATPATELPAAEAGEAQAEPTPPPAPATPDDFPFGAPPPPAEASEAPPPPPFDDAVFAPPPPARAPALSQEAPTKNVPMNPAAAFAAQGDGEATMAYPTGADPFVLAARQQQALEGEQDFNPEATRVASVPQELLRASARPSSDPEVPAVSPEEAHYQEVFREFVRTREQCGEVPDGLTYEKFAQKLRKNREMLVAKYNCRTVRFQVHVKDGRAALKATPIKD